MIQAPIFHVNGDDPEAVVRVARLAFEYRQAFNKDVVIDLVCYRRRGHNEGDDPSMTNPRMYQIIDAKRSVRKLYTEELIGRGDITVERGRGAAARLPGAAGAGLQGHPRRGRHAAPRRPARRDRRAGAAGRHRGRRRRWCAAIGEAHVDLPEGFTPHKRVAAAARAAGQDGRRGRHRLGLRRDHRVRLAAARRASPCGWPARTRGAARSSQRHASIVDAQTGEDYLPLSSAGRRRRRPVLRARLAAQRVRGDGLRVRLLGGEPRRAGALGGAVRRLRQRRPVDRRRVHLLRRGEVGPAVVADAAAAARPRGPGPGPHVRPPRALPAAVRRGQHAGGDPDHPGELLPPAAPPGPVAASASRWWSSRRSRCCGTGWRCRRSPTSPPARSSRCSATPGSTAPADRRRSSGCCSAPARSTTTCSRPAPSAASPTPRSSGWSSSTRCRSRSSRRRWRSTRTPRTSPGCRRSRPTRAPGRSWRSTCSSTSTGVRLRRISRPAAAAPAVGSAKLHDAEQAALIEAALPQPVTAPTFDGGRSGPRTAAPPAYVGSGDHVLHRPWHRGAGRAARRGDGDAWSGWPSGCATSSTSTPSSRRRSSASPPGWPASTRTTSD